MNIRILEFWRRLRASYWFVPSLMTAAAFALSNLMIRLDERIPASTLANYPFIYQNQPDGARALLSTVAGSMIGVAGVSFSLTMVVLSLTASQYGPRLLNTFMRDTSNQIVLGTFVATYLYCLLVLRTVHATDAELFFVPSLAIMVAVGLAVACVGVFIYFIHNISQSIRAGSVISSVRDELLSKIEKTYEGLRLEPNEDDALPKDFEAVSKELCSDSGGYIQAINTDALIKLAQERDALFKIEVNVGDFIGKEQVLIAAYTSTPLEDNLDEKVHKHIALGPHRADAETIETLFAQLTEVALRALSPGVNDPFTAVMCLDRIGEALVAFLEHDAPETYLEDDEGELRLILPTLSATLLIRTTLGPLRHYGAGDLIVTKRFLETVRLILHAQPRPDVKRALEMQAQLALDAARKDMAGEDYVVLEDVIRDNPQLAQKPEESEPESEALVNA